MCLRLKYMIVTIFLLSYLEGIKATSEIFVCHKSIGA